jgi:hypothetical protein
LILPNNSILINDYNKYIGLQPINVEPNFYLQEVEEEIGKFKLYTFMIVVILFEAFIV